MVRRWAPILWISLLLNMDGRAGCVLDQAQIAAVPPDTFQALISWRCGNQGCWQRFAETNGVRRGESTVCEGSSGDRLEMSPTQLGS